MLDVLEQVDFVLLEEELHDVTCESTYERENNVPEHPANWYATAPCQDVIAVCERRRANCRRDCGWWCSSDGGAGCNAYHPYENLEWRRIK